MTRLPGAIFVADVKREAIAVREADRLGIPVIAITDTNADPDLVGYPVPGNDDAIRSVGLITQAIAQSVLEASAQVPEEQKRKVQDAQATTYSTEPGDRHGPPQPHATPWRNGAHRPGTRETLRGTARTEASAEYEKVKDEKCEDEKAEDEKAEATKAEDEKAEATKAEDEKAEAAKAEDEKAAVKKAPAKKADAKKADAKKGKTKKAKASAKEKVVAKAESGEAESGS